MANDIIILKHKCEHAEKELKAISVNIVALCEKMLSACNEWTTAFGEPKNEKAKSEIIDLCVKGIKQLNSLSESALDQINVIYQSVMKFNEFGSTPYFKKSGVYSSADIFTNSYFFTLANEIGNIFEDLFEKDIPNALNDVLNGLDIDKDGASLKISVVISNVKKIANYVSKATKFYFNED